MGYGGNLIWTTVFKALHDREKRPIAPVHMPLLSDLMAGRLYDAGTDLSGDAIFSGNPRLQFLPSVRKGKLVSFVDRLFLKALSIFGLRSKYERWILRRSDAGADGIQRVHIDMRLHSYAARQDRRRTYWKPYARAVDAMLEHLGGGHADDQCEMYFTAAEQAEAELLVAEVGKAGHFVVFEPDTNRAFFGDLRAWPTDRWEALVEIAQAEWPGLPFVQVGIGAGAAISGAIDLRGRTSFRVASLVMKQAALFIGTESGLMHAANAVGARALILWGGITLPEFIGYPRRQTTICKYVPCAPCGNNGWCDREHICMRDISVHEVVAAVRRILEEG